MKIQSFERETHDGRPDGRVHFFWCVACAQRHIFNTDRPPGVRPCWAYNGDPERPTFSPSLNYPDKTPRCHLFLRDGRVEYCGDCGHEYAGKTVNLPDIPDEMLVPRPDDR